MSEEKTKKPPALYRHCVKVYTKMADESTKSHLDNFDGRIWSGFTTKMFRELELATPTYSEVLNRLKMMGCIVQLRAGGGPAKSFWGLMKEPVYEEFEQTLDRASRLSPRQSLERRTTQQNNDLSKRISDLERAVEWLTEIELNRAKEK